MTTTHTSGAAIQRYKIGYHPDEWGQRSSTPSGIPDASGSWVRNGQYECSVRIMGGLVVLLSLVWDGKGFVVPFPMVVYHWRGLTKAAASKQGANHE